MTEAPLVSIIIPAYNAEKWIGECIRSIQHQLYPEKEIIVVDDGSTDRTAEIVRSYPNVQLYSLSENHGCGYALRYGFGKARGKYSVFLAADDSYMITKPNSLCDQVRAMEKGIASWSYFRDFYEDGAGIFQKIEPYWLFFRFLNPMFERYSILRFFMLFLKNPILSSGVMFHTGAYFQYGEWDPETHNADCDRDLFFRWSLKNAPLVVLPDAAVVYRLHGNQLSQKTEAMRAGYRYSETKAWKLFKQSLKTG